VLLFQLLVAAAGAAIWQVGVAVSPQFGSSIPTFTDTVVALVRELGTVTLWVSIGQTLAVTASGVALCLVLGIPLGLMLASHPFLTISTRFLIDFSRTVPPLAVIPLFLLLLGPTPQMSVTLIVAVGVWPILLQTVFGVRNVDQELLATARSFRVPLHRRLAFVVAPASMPYIFTGIRISATLSLLLAIGAELIAGVPGLGREILLSQQAASDRMFALIIIAGTLGMALAFAILAAEKKLLAWHFVPRASAL
jgi:ABC-type nitrate/sulfonate/bicarbonate transport system permease component